MSTSKQAYHLNILCPDCGVPLHHQRCDSSEKKLSSYRLYCPLCKKYYDYIADRSQVWVDVQSDRRKQPGSIRKKILKEYQLQNPVQIKEYQWLVYDFGLSGKVYYFTDTKKYIFTDATDKEVHFLCVSELINYLNEKSDNKANSADAKSRAAD
ncbi:MAG: hypothetical protein OEM38_10450 [Gammaproteobacteria bacterium]|nr:hypothetical protein [Gammaproteobacteria bacterium]